MAQPNSVDTAGAAEVMQVEMDAMAQAARLRADGLTWAAIAQRLRARFNVGGLVAMRLAHAWTRPDAVASWNRRWPADPKTVQHLGYWENHDTPDGYPPSDLALVRLAELYQCAVADLSEGHGDFRHLDSASSRIRTGDGRVIGVRSLRGRRSTPEGSTGCSTAE